eukprot:scaffold537_cov180-Ochromonas_danica.AAC.60
MNDVPFTPTNLAVDPAFVTPPRSSRPICPPSTPRRVDYSPSTSVVVLDASSFMTPPRLSRPAVPICPSSAELRRFSEYDLRSYLSGEFAWIRLDDYNKMQSLFTHQNYLISPFALDEDEL